MPRIANTFGAGAQTNRNGLSFEQGTLLDEALVKLGYRVSEHKVYFKDDLVGMSLPKNDLYKYFLEPKDISYKNCNSKKWLPDEAFINFNNKKVYIIEKKFQNCPGSVDEKLPGCEFKKLEYQKLFVPLSYTVEYVYLFSDWFKKEMYLDVLEYIKKVNCHYFFNEIPIDFLGL